MLIIRPAGPADIEALLELAVLSGAGFSSLPEHRPTLEDRLDLSERSFAGTVGPSAAWYLLVMEDSESGQVEGVAGVKGAVDVGRPHLSFRVVTLAQYSPHIATRFDHRALVPVNECSGYSEVGSLFLRAGRRDAGAGTLLARSRYMLIAAARDLFAETIMAELRGWFSEDDISPFYEGVARKFFRLPFDQADRLMASSDGQFVLDLAPRHPIYLELLDAGVCDVIGAVHRDGRPAMRLLEREGFRHSGHVDVFDGGPTMSCARDSIATVARAQPARVAIGQSGERVPLLVSTTDLPRFRAIRTPALRRGDDLILSEPAARALGVSHGDLVHACE